MPQPLNRRQMAWCAAQDIPEGFCVNLGIGVPTLIADCMPAGREILLHSENGILGMGPKPPEGKIDLDLINAGKEPVTMLPGGAIFHHNDAFVMIRGGHIDLVVLGAFQVSTEGDLANWSIDDPSMPPAVGGAMDLAVGAKRIWVMMELLTRTGESRLVETCSYPLTAAGVTQRVYTNYGVFEPAGKAFRLVARTEGCQIAELKDMAQVPIEVVPDCPVLAPPRFN